MNIKNNNSFSGFTLIELLIVVAIMGLLASIVIASLTQARYKASNGAIKQNFNGLRPQAELIYDMNTGKYTPGLCTDTKIVQMLDAASIAGTGATGNHVCNSNDNYWVASVPLKTAEIDGSTYWCADYTGKAKGEMSNITSGVTTFCP